MPPNQENPPIIYLHEVMSFDVRKTEIIKKEIIGKVLVKNLTLNQEICIIEDSEWKSVIENIMTTK